MASIDILGSAGKFINLDFGLMGIVAVILLVFVAAGIFLGAKYPRKDFLVSRDGTRIFRSRRFRLDGDEIVSDNIFEILFQGNNIGEDIKEFQAIDLNGKTVYLAAQVKKHLVPIVFTPNIPIVVEKDGKEETQFMNALLPNEITVGVKIAERNIELQRKKKLITDANKNLLMNVMTVAPIALILLATIIGGYVGAKAITDAQKEVVVPLKGAITELNMLNENLAQTYNMSIPKRYVAPNATGG